MIKKKQKQLVRLMFYDNIFSYNNHMLYYFCHSSIFYFYLLILMTKTRIVFIKGIKIKIKNGKVSILSFLENLNENK